MNLTTATPVEIDTALAALWNDLYAVESRQAMAVGSVFHAAGARRVYGRGRSNWSMTLDEALDKSRAIIADTDPARPWEKSDAVRAVERYDGLVAEAAAIHAEIARHNAEFSARGGWTRAYLVTDGHVHSGMNCSTCNNGEHGTQFTWLVDYAARTEAEVVEAAANRACTVCYPSAPVETAGESLLMTPDERTRAEKREEAAKAKEERLAKKIEKGLTADGSEFVVSHPGYQAGSTQTEYFKTEQAAIQWVVRYTVWGANGHEDYTPAIDAIVEAVAAKHGKTVEAVREEIAAKVEAKRKRDAR